jgi:hypothetical protein
MKKLETHGMRSRASLSTLARLLLPVAAGFLALGWGGTGHRFINTRATGHLPSSMQLFIQDSTYFGDHGSDADIRKGIDTSESPKHYIDLENIPAYGNLTPNLDSLIAVMGWEAVKENGILPWAAVRAYDSLVAQLRRGDWLSARLTASDVGHYVGDGHQPLHNTANYNGQFSGNGGIHSRYESGMINANEGQLVVRPASVTYIRDRFAFVLACCIDANALVDSIMMADDVAKTASGWNGSGTPPAQYYSVLWEQTRSLTLREMQSGTEALASLWYSAWVDAGLIVSTFTPMAESRLPSGFSLAQNFPNPFNSATTIRFTLPEPAHTVLKVYDCAGREVATLVERSMEAGERSVRFDAAGLASGVYLYRLKAGSFVQSRKMILMQ